MVTPTLTSAPVELDRWRRDTPGCRERIHLNNAGAGLMPRPVLDALTNHLAREATIGGYEAADEAEPLVRETYALVAQLVGAAPRNIALVENATVAFSQALSAFDFRPGDRIVTTRTDYPSNQLMYLSLARRAGVETVRADSRTGSSPTPSSSASAPPPVMPSRPAGWGMSEPGGSPRCCASGSRRCRRGGCSTAAGSGAPSSRSTSAGRTPPSWSCVSASAASTPARPTACPACSIWTRNARPRCSASHRTTTIRKTSSMPRSRRSSTWYADDPTSHAVAGRPRGGAARAGSQEPARDGHAGDRRNSGDDRLQPTGRPRPNAVRRAGAMGQSVVSRGGRGHDDRAHQGCPGRGAASRRRQVQHLGDSRLRRVDADLQQGCGRVPHPLPRSGAGRAARRGEAAGGTVHGSAGVLLSGRGRGPGPPEPALGRDRRAGPAGDALAATG